MQIEKWKKSEILFLETHYLNKGKMWCAEKLNRGEGSIRQKASSLNLRLSQDGKFFKDFQKRAAISKIGKKHSKEWNRKIRKGQEGKKKSKEHKINISKGLKKMYKDNPEKKKEIIKRKKEWYKKNKHPRGMLGKHHKKETKEKIRQAHLGKIVKKETIKKRLDTNMKKYGKVGFLGNNTYSRCKRGWAVVGNKKCFFRSGWEKNYAFYLEWLKSKKEIKEWRYETKTFWFEKIKRGVRSYLPDFEITNKKGLVEYHEVKGWMDAKSKTKLKRMAKYFPDVRIILIDEEQYKSIKKWSRMIEGWSN